VTGNSSVYKCLHPDPKESNVHSLAWFSKLLMVFSRLVLGLPTELPVFKPKLSLHLCLSHACYMPQSNDNWLKNRMFVLVCKENIEKVVNFCTSMREFANFRCVVLCLYNFFNTFMRLSAFYGFWHGIWNLTSFFAAVVWNKLDVFSVLIL
jgi:hypothetical protein